jgi:hypothetical protein
VVERGVGHPPTRHVQHLASALAECALIALEGLAVACTGRGRPGAALLAHLLAACAAVAVVRFGARQPGWPLGAAFGPAALVLALPCVGAAVLLGVLLPAWRRRAGSEEIAIFDLPPPSHTDERMPEHASTPRAIRELLATGSSIPGSGVPGSSSLAERLQAVLALRHLPAARAVPILKLCFKDASEDVRLLAFADLERRESKLRARIQLTSTALAAGSLPRRRRAQLTQRLASEHWELVEGGFVSGALEARVLELAATHAEAAFELGARGPAAILLARLALRRGQADAAGHWLEAAEGAGVSQAVCAPLFAEAAFRGRRFSEVGQRLARAARGQLRRPELDPVVEFWTSERAS